MDIAVMDKKTVMVMPTVMPVMNVWLFLVVARMDLAHNSLP